MCIHIYTSIFPTVLDLHQRRRKRRADKEGREGATCCAGACMQREEESILRSLSLALQKSEIIGQVEA